MLKKIVTLSALVLILSSQAMAQSLFENSPELTQDQIIEADIQAEINKALPISPGDIVEMQSGLDRSINDLAVDSNSGETKDLIKFINHQKLKSAEEGDVPFEQIKNVNVNNQQEVINFYNKVFGSEISAGR